jgi:hypothetical protein
MHGERRPLLGGRVRQRVPWSHHLLTLFAVFLCFLLLIVQALFQTYLPALTKKRSVRDALCIATAVPFILGSLTDLAWIPVTNHFDRSFHQSLFGAELDRKQRDSLRKVESFDTFVRISVLKVFVIFCSLAQASYQAAGAPLAITGSIALLGFNGLSRWMTGQFDVLEQTWELRLERDKLL